MAEQKIDRVSSADEGYVAGDLSVFPEALDDRSTLYSATNHAQTTLKQGIGFASLSICLTDGQAFPLQGIVRLSDERKPHEAGELVYYDLRRGNILTSLIRGFASSSRSSWSSRHTQVTAAVMAEHHNAVKDAVLKVQQKLGLPGDPAEGSLLGRLHDLEVRYLAPRPSFRAWPTSGRPGQAVRFQNHSPAAVRYLWDFGDGLQSVERNPTHTYQQSGDYTVRLNVITGSGAQGIATKNQYIKIADDRVLPFFYYTTRVEGEHYSTATAATTSGAEAQTFDFVDQTDGDVVGRYWIWGDGSFESVEDPNLHTASHVYAQPGTYAPGLIVVLANEAVKRTFLGESIEVL